MAIEEEKQVIQEDLTNTGKNVPIEKQYTDKFSHNVLAQEQASTKYNQDMTTAKANLIATQNDIVGV